VSRLVSIALGLLCLYIFVVAARDAVWWADLHWRRRMPEIVSTALIAIVFFACGVAFIAAGVQ
jgi:hypothetical protein